VSAATGRGLYGASVLAGGMVVAEAIFGAIPRLASLRRALETLELYFEKVVPALAPLIEPKGLGLVVIAGLGWVSAFLALAAFTRFHDGLSLWQHIARNSCWRNAEGSSKAVRCTLPKWLATLALGPLIILVAFVKRIAVGVRTITIGYVSFDPSVIASYFKHVGMAAVAFVTIAAALGYTAAPASHATAPLAKTIGGAQRQ